jgi:hypothetical protein
VPSPGDYLAQLLAVILCEPGILARPDRRRPEPQVELAGCRSFSERRHREVRGEECGKGSLQMWCVRRDQRRVPTFRPQQSCGVRGRLCG